MRDRLRGWKPFRKRVVVKPTSLEAVVVETSAPDSEEKNRRILEALKRNMPGLPLSLDLARETVNQQMSQADALDTKAGFILGSTSILVAVFTAWRKPTLHVGWLSVLAYVCVGLAIGGFGWIAWQAAKGYAVTEYTAISEPKTLVENIVYQDEKTAQYLTLLALREAIERNTNALETKAKYVQSAFRGLIVEALFLALVIVLELAFS